MATTIAPSHAAPASKAAPPVVLSANKPNEALELAQLKRELRLKTQLLKDQKQSIERYAKKLSDKEKQITQKEQALQKQNREHEGLKQLIESLRLQLQQAQRSQSSASASSASAGAGATTEVKAPPVPDDLGGQTVNGGSDEVLLEDDKEPMTSKQIELEIERRVASRLANEKGKWEAEHRSAVAASAASLSAAEKALQRYKDGSMRAVGAAMDDDKGKSQQSVAKSDEQQHVQSLLVEMQQGRLHSSYIKLFQRLQVELGALKNTYQETRHEVLTMRAAVRKMDAARSEAQQETDRYKAEVVQLKAKVQSMVTYFKKI